MDILLVQQLLLIMLLKYVNKKLLLLQLHVVDWLLEIMLIQQ